MNLRRYFILLLFIASTHIILSSQMVVGSYTGITQLSYITSTCASSVENILGDTNFTTNSGVEINIGTTFTGIWANGQGYVDGPGPEILCVSIHTYETWNVRLLLSDMSFTPPVIAHMNNILDTITFGAENCVGYNYLLTHERRIGALDFNMFMIPPGLQVIGARFTLLSDNYGQPDPTGMLYIGQDNNIHHNFPLCVGDTLLLDVDTVPNGIYNWSGPGGFTSSINNPAILDVTSMNAGIYTCIVTDTLNSTVDTLITTIFINSPPVADLFLHNNPNCMGETLFLDASGSTPLANITSFHYDLDSNGIYELSSSYYAYSESSSLLFNQAGDILISLIAETNMGCVDTAYDILHLYSAPAVDLTVTDSILCTYDDANFDVSAFIDNPVGQTSTITNYAWFFNNNGIMDTSGSSLTNITYNFPTPGIYPVSVMAVSDMGCSGTDLVYVTFFDVPQGNIVAPQVCVNEVATFSFNNIGSPLSNYAWNFGDTTVTTDVSTSSEPTYLFPGFGTYYVTLIVSTSDGCVDTMTNPLNVSPIPNVYLGPDIYHPSPPAILDAGFGYISYLWNTLETTQTITVNTDGTFYVTVTDSAGCMGSDSLEVVFTAGIQGYNEMNAYVFPNPSANFIYINALPKVDEFVIADLSGKIVMAKKNINCADLTQVANGLYLVTIYAGGKDYTCRLIVQH